MEDYLSEREQIESLRGAAKENAPWALAAVLIAGAMILGWQQYQGWRQRQSVTASQKYTATLEALSRADKTSAAKIIDELKSDYARTPYADLATLALVRFEVATNDLADAAKRLEDVMQTARDPELRVVARLRLARVQRAQAKPDLALATLAGVPEKDSTAAFTEVKGDALADKGDKAGALAAWREALDAKMPGLVNRELLELKVASLGALPVAAPAATAPATATAAPAPPATAPKGQP